ncbi:MAG: hypothetical protein COV44_07505 [Deltaproteobacteria bacterium CG11_big_fil_rev_8_21_14_0_20_45_16]|nr:MAG: hypothetical protein COV44_07505 [Deltaproteobacteria bacterium CG11_big_fil_rev_8_21_14_0_20_45_16]
MKIVLSTLAILSGLSMTPLSANEDLRDSETKILVTKAELQGMVENMHEEFMAKKEKQLKEEQLARRKEMLSRFSLRRGGDFR